MTDPNNSLTLRPVGGEDAAFLLEVYKSSRGEALRELGWDETRVTEFLQMQYEAQRTFDAQDYAQAKDEVILSAGEPAGRSPGACPSRMLSPSGSSQAKLGGLRSM